ncbi:phenylalanine aminotransferase [Kineosphaera limosa NBRC 100340]|uniref:Aromatic amino acid aminotransferase n=1 Tax=Kineosphaera limosa NBRC 100340 TaxID=1184609 RepID=K6VLA0_9MICO|nr:phenylalanine aminotransferase [Kineosphaera limosa NBRC 100340]
MPAYKPGKPPTPVEGLRQFKLSSNENPYPPLPSVVQAITDAAQAVNRYPDAGMHALRERIAEQVGVTADEIVPGPGSVGVLDQIFTAVVEEGTEVVYAWRSFEMYPIAVAVAGGRSVQVPLTADGRHDLPKMAASINDKTRLVLVCSPNNPTGAAVTGPEFEDFMAKVPGDVLVVFDEAYIEFDTADDKVDSLHVYQRYPNLVLLRTFSKAYGLAGLRVGYAVAHPPVAAELGKTGLPFAVTDLAQHAALASLAARDELLVRVKELCSERERVVMALAQQGWTLPVTQGNFVWLPLGEEAAAFAQIADAAGVSVRPFAGDGVRCSIGEPDANDTLLKVCEDFQRSGQRRPGSS